MFDACPDRTDTDSLKWSRYRGRDVLPMWVADMDCVCAEPILDALRRRVEHGVFGYAVARPADTDAVIDWLQNRHNWAIRREWLVWLPGLVPALNVACRAFADPDQDVATFTPIYPPFLSAPVFSDRRLLTCPLTRHSGHYTFDLDALAKTVTPQTRLLLLCSPHNPVGRLWTQDELLAVADFCLQRNIVLCSDEIHCDLVLDENRRHIPTATLSPEIADNTITLMSPAKTFNLPGLNCGFAVIASEQLRRRFVHAARGILPHVNAMGYTACRRVQRMRPMAANSSLISRQLIFMRPHQRPARPLRLARRGDLSGLIDATGLNVESPPNGSNRPASAFRTARTLTAQALCDSTSVVPSPGWKKLRRIKPPSTR